MSAARVRSYQSFTLTLDTASQGELLASYCYRVRHIGAMSSLEGCIYSPVDAGYFSLDSTPDLDFVIAPTMCFTNAMKCDDERIQHRVTFSVDKGMLALLDDRVAESVETTRSAEIRRALRAYLGQEVASPSTNITMSRPRAPRPQKAA